MNKETYETIDKANPIVKCILLSIIKRRGRCPITTPDCVNNCPVWNFCMKRKSKTIALYGLVEGRFIYCIDLYTTLYGEDALKGDIVEDLI